MADQHFDETFKKDTPTTEDEGEFHQDNPLSDMSFPFGHLPAVTSASTPNAGLDSTTSTDTGLEPTPTSSDPFGYVNSTPEASTTDSTGVHSTQNSQGSFTGGQQTGMATSPSASGPASTDAGFQGSQNGSAQMSDASASHASSSKSWIAAAVIVPVAVVALVALGVFLLLRRRRRQRASQHRQTESTSTAGALYTGRTSRSASDAEKVQNSAKYGAYNDPVSHITQPASSVQRNYETGIDLSSASSINADRSRVEPAGSERVISPPPPYMASSVRVPSSVLPSPLSLTGSNPFTERSNGSSNAISFSGFSGAGVEYPSSSNNSQHVDMEHGDSEPPRPISSVPEHSDEQEEADIDDDAISSISEGEIQESTVARVGRAHRASVIDLDSHSLGSAPRRPS